MDDANAMTLVRTTVGDEKTAKDLAKRLIDDAHAVCVHVHPITSTYRWKTDIVEEGEWLVEARALTGRAEDCWVAMQDKHPYDVPLVEMIGQTRVNGAYARWANESAV